MPRQLRSSTTPAKATPYDRPVTDPRPRSPSGASAGHTKKGPSGADPSTTALLFASPEAFIDWLTTSREGKQHSSSGTWLRLAKKSCPTDDLTYDQALDVALAHGWIDGQRKSLKDDPHYFIQRFTPRREKSLWSKRNVGIIERLLQDGKMTDAGMKEVETAKSDGRWERAYSGGKDIQTPGDFEALLKKDGKAWDKWEELPRGERYHMLLRLETLRTDKGREKKMMEYVQTLRGDVTP